MIENNYTKNLFLENNLMFLYENLDIVNTFLESNDISIVLEASDDEKLKKDIETFLIIYEKEINEKFTESNKDRKISSLIKVLNMAVNLLSFLIAAIFPASRLYVTIATLLSKIMFAIKSFNIENKNKEYYRQMDDISRKLERLANKAKNKKDVEKLQSLSDRAIIVRNYMVDTKSGADYSPDGRITSISPLVKSTVTQISDKK